MIKSFYLAALTAAFLFSCSTENPQKSRLLQGKVVVDVDGDTWTSTEAIAVIGNGGITITGTKEDGTQVVVSVLISTQADIYPVQSVYSGLAPCFVSYNDGASPEFSSVHGGPGVNWDNIVGSIDITEIDEVNKTISGTFYSTAKPDWWDVSEVKLEKGTFTKIPYTAIPTPVVENTFSGKLDGETFTTISIDAWRYQQGTVGVQFMAGLKSIMLSFPDNIAPGTYSLVVGPDGCQAYLSHSGLGESWDCTTGSLTITEHNMGTNRVTGTFNFIGETEGYSPISVTEASFDLIYVVFN